MRDSEFLDLCKAQSQSTGKQCWMGRNGVVEPGEGPEKTAVGEVKEETGVTASTRMPLDALLFGVDKDEVRCKMYLMDYLFDEPRTDHQESMRTFDWKSYEDARMALNEVPESQHLLRDAHLLCSSETT